MRGNGVLGCSTLPVNAVVWVELGIFSEYALKTEGDARRAKVAAPNTYRKRESQDCQYSKACRVGIRATGQVLLSGLLIDSSSREKYG